MCKNISKKSKIEEGDAFWNLQNESTWNTIRKSPTDQDGHSLKSASPYEKTNSPAQLASLASLTDKSNPVSPLVGSGY